ncbi:hypothetical protein SAY87_009216 [Trapa incisa]|uniref:Uncharacterized protein n=1 Tax=Trapa incisa TaxID=236973 RepID=A0AAN7JZ93_9MYRT|nr:hypothetical protein SAY87_009216 [Trapa incisa]
MLVNAVNVLRITMADQDSSVDILECIHIVNPTVSIVVAACRGVDVTPKKLARKYAKVCMALDIALRRVSSIRLSAMLFWMHEEGIAKMVHSALDTEAESRVILHQHEPHGSSTAAFFTPGIEDIGPNTRPRDFCREFSVEAKKLWYLADPAIFTSVYQYCAITQLFTGHISTPAQAAIYIENSNIVGFSFGAWVACMVWVNPSMQKMPKRERHVDAVWAGIQCGATGHVRGIHAAVPLIMNSVFKELHFSRSRTSP